MPIEQRQLGKDGPMVSAISLGLMGVGGGITYYDDSMKDSAEAAVAKFLEMGGNMVDTSDVYGPAKSEEILGEWIKKFGREKFFIATKGTLCSFLSKEERFQNWGAPCADPDYIEEAVSQSLDRLGVDCIDLYYLHRMDPKTPIAATMEKFKTLVEAGKIKYIGLSEHTPERIREAHAVHPITAVQQEWSVMARDLEADVVPVCRELGIGIVPYSPMARGLLTGTQRSRADLPQDWRTAPPDSAFGTCGRYLEENLEKNVALVDKFAEIAKQKGCTPAQLALAWVLAQGSDVVPIPASTKAARVEENLGAIDVQLSAEDFSAIAEAVPQEAVAGARYTGASMTYNGQ